MTPTYMFSPQDAKCTFRHHVDGVLKDVGKGSIVQPKGLMMHNKPIPTGWFRVRLVRDCKGCKRIDPPRQPEGAEEHKDLDGCCGWPLLWPKTQIRLAKEAPATAPKVHPPLIVANTKRHKQLAAHTPSPQPNNVEVAPKDDVDSDNYLKTNAMATNGFYMPPLGEPASRGQQAGRPLSCTQRL